MATNRVQIRPALSMRGFLQRYGSEARCEQALAAARWPHGFACPVCRCRRHTMFERARVAAGTNFASTELPLFVWLLAMHLMTQATNDVCTLELRSPSSG